MTALRSDFIPRATNFERTPSFRGNVVRQKKREKRLALELQTRLAARWYAAHPIDRIVACDRGYGPPRYLARPDLRYFLNGAHRTAGVDAAGGSSGHSAPASAVPDNSARAA